MIRVEFDKFGELQNNCYLITDDSTGEAALVDCTEYNDKMLDLIGNADLKYILLTHGHFDHIGGVAEVKKKFGAKIVISFEDSQMLLSSKHSLGAFFGLQQEKMEADVIVKDGDTISLGESNIEVLATPGHTKGGVCYIVDDKIFTGDTLFYASCGRTDFPGGSASEIVQSLKKLSNLQGDYILYPGHDKFSNLDFERKNNPYMR